MIPFLIKNKDEELQDQYFISKIGKLQNENDKLKLRINKIEEKENKFIYNLNNKIKEAERDIKILSFENKNNNILLGYKFKN